MNPQKTVQFVEKQSLEFKLLLAITRHFFFSEKKERERER